METEISLPQLLKDLNTRNDYLRNIAIETAKQLPPEQLLELAALESKDFNSRFRTCRTIWLSIFIPFFVISSWYIFVIGTQSSYFHFVYALFNFLNIYMFVPKRGRRSVARLISHSSDIYLLGPTISMIGKSNDSEVQRLCRLALNQQLPKVSSGHANLLTYAQKKILLQILKTPFEDLGLTISILKALEQIGDESAIPTVEKLTHYNSSMNEDRAIRIQKAAEECLVYLRQNSERTKISSTLLRASSEPCSPDSLLRPVMTSRISETDSHELLRAERTE